MKSGGFGAHENPGVMNMAIRKKYMIFIKLVAAINPTAALSFVNEQQSNSQ